MYHVNSNYCHHLNEMPRVKDKSDSFYRRQLFIPFTKCFTGAERKYIKDDYLKRKEVVEYVMYKVLNMNYYEFDVPEACKTALEEYTNGVPPLLEIAAITSSTSFGKLFPALSTIRRIASKAPLRI